MCAFDYIINNDDTGNVTSNHSINQLLVRFRIPNIKGIFDRYQIYRYLLTQFRIKRLAKRMNNYSSYRNIKLLVIQGGSSFNVLVAIVDKIFICGSKKLMQRFMYIPRYLWDDLWHGCITQNGNMRRIQYVTRVFPRATVVRSRIKSASCYWVTPHLCPYIT